MKCPYCKSPMIEEFRTFTSKVGEEEVLIEDVPTMVCEQCDHFVIDAEVAEAIEDMLFGLEEGVGNPEVKFEVVELDEEEES